MPNDFTVADVLEWARTKPADVAYDYTSPGNCALCQFLRETGRAADPVVTPYNWQDRGRGRGHFSVALEHALLARDDRGQWTFGALVKRLEAIVQETPAKPSPWLNPQTYLDADCGENVW